MRYRNREKKMQCMAELVYILVRFLFLMYSMKEVEITIKFKLCYLNKLFKLLYNNFSVWNKDWFEELICKIIKTYVSHYYQCFFQIRSRSGSYSLG